MTENINKEVHHELLKLAERIRTKALLMSAAGQDKDAHKAMTLRKMVLIWAKEWE